jgi:hypothetical protein
MNKMKTTKNLFFMIVLLIFSTMSFGQNVELGQYAVNITSISIKASDHSEIAEYSFTANNVTFEHMYMKRSDTFDCDDIDEGETYSTNGYVTIHKTGYVDAVGQPSIGLTTRVGWHDGNMCTNYLWQNLNTTISLAGKVPYYSSSSLFTLGRLTINYILEIKPDHYKLYYYSPNVPAINYLTYQDTFKLMASRGFDNSAYVWKYRYIYYGTFGPVTITKIFEPAFNNNDTITFRGADILTESEMNYLIANNLGLEVFIDFHGVPTTTLKLMPISSAPHITATYQHETCNGENDAKIIVHLDRVLYNSETVQFMVNGEPTHQEFIDDTTIMLLPSNGQGAVFKGYPSGTHNIGMYGYYNSKPTYTDSKNHSATIIISARPKVILPVPTTQNISCYGGNNGKVSITPQGGVGKYTAYLIRNTDNDTIAVLSDLLESNTYTFSGLLPDVYKVILVDTNLCSQAESQKIVTLTQPSAPLAIDYITITPLTGYETGNGIITAKVSGGTEKYNVWLKQGDTVINSQQLDDNIFYIENLSAGIYTLLFRDTVYDLAYSNDSSMNNIEGCFVDSIIEITQPDPLIVVVEQTESILCFGDSTAELVAHAVGGVQYNTYRLPYDYKWFAVGSESVVLSTDSVVSGLPVGDYQVKVTDINNNITYSDPVTVTQPTLLTVEYTVLHQNFCIGDSSGKIQAVVSGGTPPYIYHWYPSGKTTAIIDSISNRAEIAYIEDSNGCRTEDVEIVLANVKALFARALEIINPSCFGYSDGAITVEVLGGVPPYLFEWNDEVAAQNRENLVEGVYKVDVMDSESCVFTQTFTLTQPDEIKFPQLPSQLMLCKGQTIELDAELDLLNVNYNWTDNTGAIISNEPQLEINTGGLYKIKAITGDNCEAYQEVSVTESDTELKTDFVVATKIPKYKTINAVNITKMPTDSVKWIVPNNVFVASETDDLLQLKFSNNGEYKIALTGYREFCTDVETKTVSVVDDIEIEYTEQNEEPFLKQFMVVPNPNNGNFEVYVELREISDYQLILYNDKGMLIDTKEIKSTEGETTLFNENGLEQGVYLVRFVSSQTVSTIKMIVQ